MDESQPVEVLLDDDPEVIRATGMALRSLIFRSVPGAAETVRPGWRRVAYSLPDGRRVRTFAWIGPERKHIHLRFEHGRLLADYVRRAADLATMPSGARRALALERATDVDDLGTIPGDWVPITGRP